MGVVAASYIRYQIGGASAAGENITVTNNNQVSTVDHGTPQIVRTSTVTVKDVAATLGYRLAAKVPSSDGSTSIPGATVTMYPTIAPQSPNASSCTQVSPCTLPVDDGTGATTPIEILEVGTNNTTAAQGDTTEWTVTITLPGGTAEGNYCWWWWYRFVKSR